MVDDRTEDMDDSYYMDDNEVYDEYWNWSVPLLVNGPEGPSMIISKHGLDIATQTKQAIQSLITPAPHSIIRETELYGDDKGYRCVERIGEGCPIVILPSILCNYEGRMTSSYVCEDVFRNKDIMSGICGVFMDIDQCDDDSSLILETSYGRSLLYIQKVEEKDMSKGCLIHKGNVTWFMKTTYSLSTTPTDDPIWLNFSTFKYILSSTRHDLVKQLHPYRDKPFTSISLYPHDISISYY
jgi:hypothetical protein